MYFIRCIVDPVDTTSNARAIGLCWADVGSLVEARSAAKAMAADSGWTITTTEEEGEATIDDFMPEGQDFFRRAVERGVYMVMYTYPTEVPIKRVQSR